MYDLDKKIIFTHPPKCGGTSIEDLLGFLDLREIHPEIHSFKHASLEKHLKQLKNKNLEEDDFFKFSIIRNPWDRAVSFYKHSAHKEYFYYTNRVIDQPIPKYVTDARSMDFGEFAHKYYVKNFNSEVATKPFMFNGEKFILNFVIKMENIKEDLTSISNRINIDLSRGIPHQNNIDKFTERKDYRDYYDKKTIALINRLFEWDIKQFKYMF